MVRTPVFPYRRNVNPRSRWSRRTARASVRRGGASSLRIRTPVLGPRRAKPIPALGVPFGLSATAASPPTSPSCRSCCGSRTKVRRSMSTSAATARASTTSGFVNPRSAIWPRLAPAVQRRRLGWWWWRWCSAARPRDRSLWQRWLLRSLDPASPDTVLLTADRTNVAARARLPFLRMRNHAKSRNDDPDDCQAYDRHSSPPLRHHTR
jgi:hypothetical protein